MSRAVEHSRPAGLRERKKRQTRQAILDAARELFAARGYDNVTVAEIADAVHISANTVFGYFPTKEELVFDCADQVRDALVERIRRRPTAETPLRTMETAMREMIATSRSSIVADLEWLHRTVADSPALRARLTLMWDQFEQALAEALGEETDEGPHAPRPSVVAAQLILIFRMTASERFLRYLRAHTEPTERAALDEWLTATVELIGHGIADYAPKPAPSGR
jgi:AcrR family transcriptional regulator